jgi:hypothetical protein
VLSVRCNRYKHTTACACPCACYPGRASAKEVQSSTRLAPNRHPHATHNVLHSFTPAGSKATSATVARRICNAVCRDCMQRGQVACARLRLHSKFELRFETREQTSYVTVSVHDVAGAMPWISSINADHAAVAVASMLDAMCICAAAYTHLQRRTALCTTPCCCPL